MVLMNEWIFFLVLVNDYTLFYIITLIFSLQNCDACFVCR